MDGLMSPEFISAKVKDSQTQLNNKKQTNRKQIHLMQGNPRQSWTRNCIRYWIPSLQGRSQLFD